MENLCRFLGQDSVDTGCYKLMLSKVIMLGISAGSLVYRLPVIRNILKEKSGTGLNIYGVYLESSGYFAWIAYNFLAGSSISTFTDSMIRGVQNVMIIVLIWSLGFTKEKKVSTQHILIALATAAALIGIILILGKTSKPIIATYGISMSIVSKLPQIISNYRTGKKGVQSSLSLLIAVVGASSKCIAIFIESKDFFVMLGTVLAASFNIILLAQVQYNAWKENKKLKKVD